MGNADPVDTQEDEITQTADGDDLFCPQCDYSLRGLTEDRCPECGSPFNRAEVRQWSAHRSSHPLRQPDGGQGSWVTFFLRSLFNPKQLARQLPAHPNGGMLFFYAWIMRLLAAGTALGGLAARRIDDVDKIIYIIAVPVFIGIAGAASLAEYAVAWGLRTSSRNGLRKSLSMPLRIAFCKCFSGHLVAHAILYSGIMLLLDQMTNLPAKSAFMPQGPWRLLIYPGVPLLWWSYCVSRAHHTRNKDSGHQIITLLGVFLVGLIILPLGFAIGIGVGFALAAGMAG